MMMVFLIIISSVFSMLIGIETRRISYPFGDSVRIKTFKQLMKELEEFYDKAEEEIQITLIKNF